MHVPAWQSKWAQAATAAAGDHLRLTLGHNSAMPTPITSAGSDSQCWFATPKARAAITEEQAELIPWLTGHIGVRGLFLKPSASWPRELSGNMLQRVTALHRSAAGWGGDLCCADSALPLGNECFSLIYLLHVLEQHPDPGALLGECARCLQPEGLLVVLSFNPLSPFRRHWRRSEFRAPRRGALEHLIRDTGLLIEQCRTVGSPYAPGAWESARRGLLRPLAAPFCSSFALIARKRRAAPALVGRTAAGMRARAVSL